MRTSGNREKLQREIAAVAARLMAEDGHDCAQAKRKAAVEVGAADGARGLLPDNEQIEAALREYLRAFDGPAHRELLQQRRRLAAQWMQTLARFQPYLVGPVLNGSATRHSHLRLNLYTESAKDVEMALLDLGIDIRVAPPGSDDSRAQEMIGFMVADPDDKADGKPGGTKTPILLAVFDEDALRISPATRARAQDPDLHPVERAGRADLAMVRRLLEEPDVDPGQAVSHA